MAIETDLVVAARDALQSFASDERERAASTTLAATLRAPAAAEEGVTLSLSTEGRLLAALASAVETVAASVPAGAGAAPATAAQPVTQAMLFAIEARLVAARRGADAVARADRQLPPSDDPARLKQARQATESLYGRAPNPFAGLSRAQLSAIVYDESGAYTVNERYAAANQRTELDQRFWTPVFQRALVSGDWRPVIEAALAFYAGLSPLEQAAYPPDYPQLMRRYLALYDLQAQPQQPLPPRQQVELVHMMESLVLPPGPLALSAGAIRGLVLPRLMPSITELIAAAPRLADILQVNAMARGAQDSAYLVLLQRVFGVGRREDEPAVAKRPGPSLAVRDFLTADDRRYLASAYVYAQAAGIALEEVDALADDLGRYRSLRAGADAGLPGAFGPAAPGHAMSGADMLLAQHILNGRAAHETRLDHAFLAWLLNPEGGGRSDQTVGRAASLSALEKLLAAMAGVSVEERIDTATQLEAGYRLVLERMTLQEAASVKAREAPVDASRMPTLAAQFAALARSEAADLAFMNNALMLLRMYRFSLKMSDAEQRTLAELVYSSLRKRRQRQRRGKLFLAWAERNPWMPALPG